MHDHSWAGLSGVDAQIAAERAEMTVSSGTPISARRLAASQACSLLCSKGSSGTEGAQSLLCLLRVDETVVAEEARNVIGDLLARRQRRNTRAFCLRGNDFGKERAQLGGSQAAGQRCAEKTTKLDAVPVAGTNRLLPRIRSKTSRTIAPPPY